jgi:hypothetical protein
VGVRDVMAVEFDVTRLEGVNRVVFTYRGVLAGMIFGASLPDDDLAR